MAIFISSDKLFLVLIHNSNFFLDIFYMFSLYHLGKYLIIFLLSLLLSSNIIQVRYTSRSPKGIFDLVSRFVADDRGLALILDTLLI